MEAIAGTLISPHVRLVRPLGQGAMGSVWVADHLTLGTQVAVKLISAQTIRNDPVALARFRREAEAAARIGSQHVVQTLEHGMTGDGTPFLVMQLLDGESLGQRLEREGKLGLADTARVLAHVAKALDKAHAIGIVHRDIKPENVFLVRSHDLFVKVLDFGLSKQTQTHEAEESMVTSTGVLVGTPTYMSPEQVLGSKVDHRADLWALAVLAYQSITGTIPFDGETAHSLLMAICNAQFTRPSACGLPSRLDAWFERAFSPNLERRFQSAEEMADAFARGVAISAGVDAEATQMVMFAPGLPPSLPIPNFSPAAVDHDSTMLAPMPTWTVPASGPLGPARALAPAQPIREPFATAQSFPGPTLPGEALPQPPSSSSAPQPHVVGVQAALFAAQQFAPQASVSTSGGAHGRKPTVLLIALVAACLVAVGLVGVLVAMTVRGSTNDPSKPPAASSAAPASPRD